MSAQTKKRNRRGRPPVDEPNYIACIDWDFGWKHPRDFQELLKAWEDGLAVEDIARALGRPLGEVVVYIMDQWEKGNLPDRPNGLWGRRKRA
ncbi:hypothetical protein H1164_10995 [Thermoactinomyces daqus]|uniref:Helix-turn-helix domain containing protein n=1 Tax=Thermoactinomyces daqus TaxID=1329516 RepID=A0A7W1XB34_9BACL|nr:hypothetical protein [Thermoactinomyces daqus]MBA4543422.1 hypothetical protein [Thermoactinomyces daqus]